MQNYKNIGELLARAREERRMSIAEVASVLHIRPRYLQAMEAGDMAAIPGAAYAKGYLTRYASYLALDRVEILRRFELVAQENAGSHFFMPHSFSHEKRIDLSSALKCALAAALMLLVWAVWVRPDYGAISLVDPLPEKVMTPLPMRVSAPAPQKAPCFQAQIGLYPPCYWPFPKAEPSIMTIIKP
ncbi:MAG: helix-turn-helix domain-containing protein [Alphaproteobacteria bacterium]|nr:helix-turn-helix domain-containing protein [Alphaproteobacteria bacterium]